MADFNSALPVRVENPGDVIVKVADATTPSQQLAVDSSGRVTTKNADGAGNALTSQTNGSQRALDVGINVAGTQVDPRSIRALLSSDVVTVQALSTALPAGTNNIGKVSIQDSSGSALSVSNPLPVQIAASTGLVNKYNTTAALAAAGSANHDYSVTSSKTMTTRSIWASASGKIKAEVQTSPDGVTFTSFWVGFSSTANPNISIALGSLGISTTGTGSKVRIIITNIDKSAMDVYSTISGSEA